ncbi:MAG TPA: phosphate starvation-inducible protein PhoH [Ureibacillus sp.]|nr:phosphate starvation-inducible protein PhoH [Ureibacillus sp.]
MTKEYIVVHPCNIFSQGNPTQPKVDERFDIVDMYKLENTDLNQYKCMIILNFVDQDYLYEQREVIEKFLDDKKIVAFFGNLVTDFLPGQKPFIAKEIKWHGDYNLTIVKEHSIFEGVKEDDMTINKGVKGFFARGHHPAPEGAEILLRLGEDEPVTFIDRNSSKGTIFMHSGNCLFDLGGMRQDKTKTTHVLPQRLIEWAEAEYARLQEGETQNA